jgi:subtilisin family serine protease
MKPHLVLRLAKATRRLPHWRDVAAGRAPRCTSLAPSVDGVLERRNVPFFVAQEYVPRKGASSAWSDDEIASGFDRVYRVVLRSDGMPAELVAAIRLLPDVENVRPGGVASVRLPEASSLSSPSSRWGRDAIGLEWAHAVTRGDPSVVVAVLDTGIDAAHPELAGVSLPGHDFVNVLGDVAGFVGDYLDADPRPDDEQGHGTHVAGIIAGRGRRMPVGVAPQCRILPVRVLGTFVGKDGRPVGAGMRENIDQGMKWAIDQGAAVVNLSLGLLPEGVADEPHAEVIDYARRRGVTVVAAAGNDGSERQYYPSALPHVIAVGAFGRGGAVAPFSTRGRQVDVIGPGEDIYSSFAEHGYAYCSGTSQAAPFVAGTVALLKSAALRRGTELSDRQIKHALKRTADREGTRLKTRDAGYGRLNAADALKFLELKTNSTPVARRVRSASPIEARP